LRETIAIVLSIFAYPSNYILCYEKADFDYFAAYRNLYIRFRQKESRLNL